MGSGGTLSHKKVETTGQLQGTNVEYADAMGQALNALEDYKMTSEQVMEDILEMFPVPTQKDMDELYKEIYLLKKKVKALEKEKFDR